MQGLETLYQQRRAEGLVVIDVLVQDVYGGAPDGDDAASWAESLELNFTVLADQQQEFFTTYGQGGNFFVFYVLDEEGTIEWVSTQEDADTLEAVEAAVDAAFEAQE